MGLKGVHGGGKQEEVPIRGKAGGQAGGRRGAEGLNAHVGQIPPQGRRPCGMGSSSLVTSRWRLGV